MDWTDFYWRSTDGLRLHARDYPAAGGEVRSPVFCLHGLTRNARDFDALAPEIAASGRRVLAIDVRGRGLSDRDPACDYLLPVYARDVVALAEATGIARAVFVGTSMGGLITMEVAQAAPALVAAAILNDIGPELDPAGLARIAGYVGGAPDVATWADAADYLRRQNAQALPHYRDADWLRMARRLFRQADGRVIADYDPGIATPFTGEPLQIDPWQRWDGLAAQGRPLLLLRGAISDLLAPATVARMRRGRGNVAYREIAGVGHAPMLDEPDALAAIRGFLDTVD